MWYSWSGAKETHDDLQHPASKATSVPKAKLRTSHCFSLFLSPANIPDCDSFHTVHPLATHVTVLWNQYLKNVHPLVTIFFDWEVDVVVHKASNDPAALTHPERALISAICFIATISLPEDQCTSLLRYSKHELLTKFQDATERSLVISEFTVSSDRLVLQAFMLYLVSSTRHRSLHFD